MGRKLRIGQSEELVEVEGRVGGRLGRLRAGREEDEEDDGTGATATFLILTSLARAAVTPELAGAGRLRIDGPAAAVAEEEERLVEAVVVVELVASPSNLARSTGVVVVEWERGQGDRVQV